MNVTNAQFPKLSNNNYHVWKFNMELLLLERELWDVVVGDNSQAHDAKWLLRDGKARAAIGLAVEESQKILIKHLKTAKEFWETLRKHHEKANITNKVSLLRLMSSKRLVKGQSMDDHINEFLSIVDRLRDLGENLEEHKTVAFLLGTLPDDYNNLISSLEMRQEADLTIDFVKEKLIQEYKRKSGCEQENDFAFKVQKKGKFVPKCYSCGKPGHLRKDCTNKRKANNRANVVKDESDVCFCVMQQKLNSEWYVDSAATNHMCCDEKYFTNLNEMTDTVYMANGTEVKVCGVGDCKLFCENKEIRVKNVLFIPELDGSLLSVRRLTDTGFEVKFDGNGCKISKNGEIHATGYLNNNLFVLNHKKEKIFNVSECKNDCIHVWHRRLGHRNIQDIAVTVSKELVQGIKIMKCKCSSDCEVCLKGKLTRNKFPKASTSKSKEILDLIHCDLCGPMQNTTPGGNKYFLTLIDDYSRYCTVFFLASKDMAYEKIKQFIEQSENQLGKRLKILRTDRGGEFVNKQMQQYFKEKGIIHQLTAPYTPEQNGVAERKNRSLMEMARCMLFDADMNLKFWAEAVNNANYIQNRILSAAVNVTPFELWNGKPPNLKHIRIFGAVAYAQINKQKRRKLDEVSIKCKLVGYAEESKAFRLLNIGTEKIIISRDVKFLELNDDTGGANYSSGNAVVKGGSGAVDGGNVVIGSGDSGNEYVYSNNVMAEIPYEDGVNDISTDDFYGFEPEEEVASSSNLQTSPQVTIRSSSRNNKGVPPKKYAYKVCYGNDPVSYEDALSRPDNKFWAEAMKEEIKALQDNNTWELVEVSKERKNCKLIDCKWVFKIKHLVNGEKRYKARLVARGFSQKYGESYDEVFAPVVKPATFRCLLAIASYDNMKVRHVDIKTAFLYGDIDAEIFMKQPKGYITPGKENFVCKLNHSLYGLKQSARCWNIRINKVLIDAGFRRGKTEPCLYVRGSEDSIVYVLIYVDDVVIASKNNEEVEDIIQILKSQFEITDLGDLRLYLGIEVTFESGIYYLSQEEYIDKILEIYNLQDAKISSIPMDPGYLKLNSNDMINNNNIYRKAIGSMLYISNNTRPDIAVAISILSRKINNPNNDDWTELKRVMKYLKGTKDLKLCVGSKSELHLKGFADADWAGDLNDRKSTSGFIFKLGDAVISYASRKQQNVTLSSTEAEFVSLAEASQEFLWLSQLMKEFEINIQNPIIFEDNQSCLKIIQDEKISPRSKHIDVKYYFVRDLLKTGKVLYKYCPTDSMMADILTKPLQKTKIYKIRELIGLHK